MALNFSALEHSVRLADGGMLGAGRNMSGMEIIPYAVSIPKPGSYTGKDASRYRAP